MNQALPPQNMEKKKAIQDTEFYLAFHEKLKLKKSNKFTNYREQIYVVD
jgi:hypothetical protein